MRYKVDAVIPYVNCDDPEWLAQFNKYASMNNSTSNGRVRYHDSGTLELVLMGIRKFMPWINDIHLIVSSRSQVPDYVGDDVKIILHEDFMPKEYLPCFSSPAFEMFLPFLPVAERFVYFNDDMTPLSFIGYNDLFDEKGNPYSVVKVADCGKTNHENNILVNCYNLIMNTVQDNKELRVEHGVSPFIKSAIKECFEVHREKILDSITPLCRSSNNYSQYIYLFYQLLHCPCEQNGMNWKILFKHMKYYESFDWNSLNKYDGICMNDCIDGDIDEYVEIVKKYIDDYGKDN